MGIKYIAARKRSIKALKKMITDLNFNRLFLFAILDSIQILAAFNILRYNTKLEGI
jgi:hypothetical protein